MHFFFSLANQVTIQHIYQPQQQIQGIVQQTAQPQGQTFDQFQHVRSQQFQTAAPQQYITVQGSTAYMVPPPTIIQQQATSQTPQTVQTIASSNSNIIFQPPPHLQQVQMQVQPTAITVQNVQQQLSAPSVPQDQGSQTNCSEENRSSPNLKEENKSGSDGDSSDQKSPDIKLENDSHSTAGDGNVESSNQQSSSTNNATTITMAVPPPTLQNITIRPPPPQPQQQQMATTITLPATQVPPPIMAVPPPVQHFVGNTLITTHPQTQTHTNQIYNQVQVPVSIQQIQSAGQQIHVSTPTGQHFLVNTTPQWSTNQQGNTQLAQPHQMQQIQPNGSIQNVQITHQIAANTSEFRAIPPPGTTITAAPQQQATQQVMTFNPHVQVQLQPQMIQQVSSSQHIEHAQLIGGQITVPPPTQQFNIVQTQTPNIQVAQNQYQQQATFMTPLQQQIKAPPPPVSF